MSSETDFIKRQIAHWEAVLAQADPNDSRKIAQAKRELANYQQWLRNLEDRDNQL